jgi:hypothetical protein
VIPAAVNKHERRRSGIAPVEIMQAKPLRNVGVRGRAWHGHDRLFAITLAMQQVREAQRLECGKDADPPCEGGEQVPEPYGTSRARQDVDGIAFGYRTLMPLRDSIEPFWRGCCESHRGEEH